MREIKCRAWDDENKKWLMGYEMPNLGGFSLFGEMVLLGEWSAVLNEFLFDRSGHKADDLKVMQFTGLKDKNGREIYEGDIVEVCERSDESKSTRTVYQVSWMGPEYPAFDLDGWDGESNALAEIEQSGEWDVEVIGNIYESPELLKTNQSPIT